ncbi:MAG: hypothetical protein KatS3mg109_0184 [Pirellulaceae bacterium]|jgi:hypothetical protein|nr:MAG: hypothetical protein KatS3mg048_1568 [Caldilinea sp.]GIW89752.1 MAG: hypothetical protein KatS3mg109_0184 [Pirellulaceae bacterium]
MPHHRFKPLLMTLFLLGVISFQSVFASFSPPSSITLRVYRLESSGARWVNPVTGAYHLCSSNDTYYGCTAFCDDYSSPTCERSHRIGYPYSQNPITIPIESDYLLDVVPKEVSVAAFHLTAIQAQAIAARSYAYWHIRQGSAINNSTQFQVFVPYTFEALPSTTFPDNPSNPCASGNLNNNQRIVCNAVAPRYYIAYGAHPNDDLPAFTEYFADIRNRTVSGGQPYLIAVDDPISSHPDIVQDGHGHGMSQKGASRWARGNLSFNINRDLGAWSVRWERAEQILVHYYTGVHIRDAGNNNALLTPSYRWNPLQIRWGTSDNRPPAMSHGGTYPISVEVQNTGVSDWTCGYPNFSYELRYRWAKAGFGEVTGSGSASVCGTSKGDPSPTVNLTIQNIPNWGPGAYTIRFDIYVTSAYGNLWFRDYGWPTYNVSVCVDGPCKVYIPLVLKNYP